MRREKLVHMANQIDDFFRHQSEEDAVEQIAAHLRSFWEKRMLAQITAHLEAGGEGMHERVKKAVAALHRQP